MLCCVLGAFLCAWVLRSVYIVNYDPMRAFQVQTQPTPVVTLAPQATPSPSPDPESALRLQADADFMKDRVNLLLVGFDESPERDEEDSDVYRTLKNNFRSDVLMLLAINFEKNTVHMISIPRDTYAEIYNTRGRWKINAAFAKGGAAEGNGFSYAMKTVELLMGVPVNAYAGVNMSGLKALVDAMGGVYYDVDVEIKLNGRKLEPGYQYLDGQSVLDYCRARKGISTDVGRNDRQQRMLLAVFQQLQQQNRLVKIPQIYAAVKDDVYTSLTASQIAALATFALKLDPAQIQRSTLPGEYVSNVYNASYYVLKNSELAKLVQEEFGITIKRNKKYDLATVKRDKAAAEAKKAAEELAKAEEQLTLPADATGEFSDSPLLAARASAKILLNAIDEGVSYQEIRRLQDLYLADVAKMFHRYGLPEQVPASFASLVG